MMTPTDYDEKALEQLGSFVTSEWLDSELNSFLESYSPLFGHKSQVLYFNTYIKGLLSSLHRKSIEPIALRYLGAKKVRPMQYFLSRSTIPDEALGRKHREMMAATVSAQGGMLSVDESCNTKKGSHSAGVKRQYNGRLGKTDNCQAGVYLAYASSLGFGLVDRELYIPENWFGDAHRQLREECQIPEEAVFRTKPEIALTMINKALEEGLYNVGWIGADSVYGMCHSFLDGLEKPEGAYYFANTTKKERVFLERPEELPIEPKKGRPPKHPKLSAEPVTVEEIAQSEAYPWESAVLGMGAKGPIIALVKRIRCVACRTPGNKNYPKAGPDIWLYIRKHENGEIKYAVSDAPEGIAIEELDRAATLRWPIEQCFEECKGFLGMSHYECRTYGGWMRHMLFVMTAQLFLRAVQLALKKKGVNATLAMASRLFRALFVFSLEIELLVMAYNIKRNHASFMSYVRKKQSLLSA